MPRFRKNLKILGVLKGKSNLKSGWQKNELKKWKNIKNIYKIYVNMNISHLSLPQILIRYLYLVLFIVIL
jgi:hypothetical protein